MLVAVQGTNEFDDYNVFLRAMSVALSGLKQDDKDFVIYSLGPQRINSFVSEFSNLTERSLKSRGKKIKFFKAPAYWIEDNMSSIDYFAYLSNPKQPLSKLVNVAEQHGVEVGIFRY